MRVRSNGQVSGRRWSQCGSIGMWLLVAAAASMLAGCGDATPATSTQAAPPTTTAPPVAAQSCAELGSRHTLRTMTGTIDGSPRTALFVIPKRVLDGSVRAPAAIVFHGYTGTSRQFDRDGDMAAAVERDGFVLVLPQATNGEWYFRGYVDSSALLASELAFFDAVRARLAALDCVDSDRIVIGGGSMGGGMADFVACRRSEQIAGALLVVAEHFAMPCRPTQPIPIVSVHALDDDILPYGGGAVAGTSLTVLPVERTVAKWAEYDGCGDARRERRMPGGITRIAWQGCTAPVIHYRLERGGHSWLIKSSGAHVDSNELLFELMRSADR